MANTEFSAFLPHTIIHRQSFWTVAWRSVLQFSSSINLLCYNINKEYKLLDCYKASDDENFTKPQ